MTAGPAGQTGITEPAGMDVKKMNRSRTLAMLAGLMVLLVFVAPSVSAFEISGTYTEEGQKWLNEHWGEEITLGELAKIAYTEENYEKTKANVDAKLLEHVWSQPYYWENAILRRLLPLVRRSLMRIASLLTTRMGPSLQGSWTVALNPFGPVSSTG